MGVWLPAMVVAGPLLMTGLGWHHREPVIDQILHLVFLEVSDLTVFGRLLLFPRFLVLFVSSFLLRLELLSIVVVALIPSVRSLRTMMLSLSWLCVLLWLSFFCLILCFTVCFSVRALDFRVRL